MPYNLIGFGNMVTIGPKPTEIVHAYYVPENDRPLQLNESNLANIKTDSDLYLKKKNGIVPLSVLLVESSVVLIKYNKAELQKRFVNFRRVILKVFRYEKKTPAI